MVIICPNMFRNPCCFFRGTTPLISTSPSTKEGGDMEGEDTEGGKGYGGERG